MTRPQPRRSTLSAVHPAAPPPAHDAAAGLQAPVRSRTSVKTTTDRQKITAYVPADTAAQARAAIRHVPVAVHGYRNVSELVADALARLVQDLQDKHNDGQPWPPAEAGDVPRGRPVN